MRIKTQDNDKLKICHETQITRICVFLGRNTQAQARTTSFLTFLDHKQRHTPIGRTPLDEGSARCRIFYLTTHTTNTHTPPPAAFFGALFVLVSLFILFCILPFFTNIHAPGEIRTRKPSKHATTDHRSRPFGHWNRREKSMVGRKIKYNLPA